MKDIYELLSEINIDSSDVEEIKVSEFEREKGKKKLISSLKKRKSNKKKVVLAVASLALISIVSVTIVTPTWAENIPVIGELMKKELIDVNKQYEDYINTVGQTKSQNGIDITFENAVTDNNMFAFSFRVKNNNEEIKDPETSFMPISLKINGDDINMSGSRGCKAINKNTVEYLWNIPWEKDLPRYLNVEMDIPELFGQKGDWGVKFSIDTKDIKKNTYTKKLNKEINVNGSKFNLDEITMSPLSINVKYYGESYDCNAANMSFLVLDQDGNEVKFTGGTGKSKDPKAGEKFKIESNMQYVNNESISSLKLIPVYHDKDYSEKKIGSRKVELNNFSPFEYKLADNMSIKIESSEIDGENLIVRYNYEYRGKKIDGITPHVFDIKANGTLLEEENDMDLFRKYKSEDSITRIYKIDKAKEIEMEFYDGADNRLLENEAITVPKK